MLNRTVRSQVAERRGRLNLTNEWIPRVVTPHWKVSFFSPESSRGLNSEDEFIILVMALIRVQTHNGGLTVPFGTYIPASGTRRKEKKNWNNQHINERRVIWGGQPWLMWRQTRVHGQRLCTGELWEFVMNSVAW